jgi:epoxyqueuosine reductase
LALNDEAFRAFFSGSAIKRIGRSRFMRNVLIAAGNSDAAGLAPKVAEHLADTDPIVRGAAVWASSRLASAAELREARHRASAETDDSVLAEWAAAEGRHN